MINLAHLKSDCPFFHLFPQGIPIKNIVVPNAAVCEGDNADKPQDVYMMDLDKLTLEKFEQLVDAVHKQCDPTLPRSIAWQEIKLRGLPLRAKHVSSVSTDVPFFL